MTGGIEQRGDRRTDGARPDKRDLGSDVTKLTSPGDDGAARVARHGAG